MEIKNNQLTIEIPEGMEIDMNTSDLLEGIIKFRKKDVTYVDIEKALNIEDDYVDTSICEPNVDKLRAIDKLMNIAKYYNGNWKPNWSKQGKYKYHIMYNNNDDTYAIKDNNGSYTLNNIYFKNKEDAITVINNPDFRNILDTIYKN